MINQFLQKILGSYLEKKAELYEGSPTEGKPWYKSKAILGGIYMLLRGLYVATSAIVVQSGHKPLPDIPPMVDGIAGVILGVATVKGRIEANKPIVISQ